ncbi:MAG: hypothetical protein Q9184_007505, partial [Pyrenodesmia sp. 2 TL-2023]
MVGNQLPPDAAPQRDPLAAASRTEQDTIPLDAKVCVLQTFDLGRLLHRRWINTGDDGAQMMVLALYQTTDGGITPFMMTDVEYASFPYPPSPNFCLTKALWPLRLSGNNIRPACTLFAVKKDDELGLHLLSQD